MARDNIRRIGWVFVSMAYIGGAGCEMRSNLPPKPPGTAESSAVHEKTLAAGIAGPRIEPTELVPRGGDWFLDVTSNSGVDFACLNGREGGRFFLIESFGGGTAVLDFDLDGWMDLFFTGGGTISADDPVQIHGRKCPLYRNVGGFEFRDVTSESSLVPPAEFTQGCAVTDFDGDGFPDLFVCGLGLSRLYRNQGDGTYAPLSAESVPATGWGTAAAFGDIDRDGLPDLLLTRYTDWSPSADVECRDFQGIRDLCGPTSYHGTTSLLFHNSGDGTFADWSERAGVTEEVRGLGAVALDLNEDGWVDFFVASDESPNRLYLGRKEFPLTEAAELTGVALGEWGTSQGSMGVGVADYNLDGLPDLFITNFENEDDSLYRNVGNGLFVHGSAAVGLSGQTRMRVGFGTAFIDFDHDGWPDLFVLNGNTSYSTGQTPFRQFPQLFRNIQGKRFEDISKQGGAFFRDIHAGRGAAFGDLNNDGALDLVTVQINEPVRIQANQNHAARYAAVQLVARQGEREAIGARAWSWTAERRETHYVTRGTGFFSQSDPRMYFTIPPDSDRVTITVAWPGRETETFDNLPPNECVVLIEGKGKLSE